MNRGAFVAVSLRQCGEKNKTIYKRLYDVTAHGGYVQKGKPIHTARMRYCGQDIVVYLIDGQWVSYGEVVSVRDESVP